MRQAREYAILIYEALYNYSDQKIEIVLKHESLKILFKYFVENSNSVQELVCDPKKAPHLHAFYQYCAKS